MVSFVQQFILYLAISIDHFIFFATLIQSVSVSFALTRISFSISFRLIALSTVFAYIERYSQLQNKNAQPFSIDPTPQRSACVCWGVAVLLLLLFLVCAIRLFIPFIVIVQSAVICRVYSYWSTFVIYSGPKSNWLSEIVSKMTFSSIWRCCGMEELNVLQLYSK